MKVLTLLGTRPEIIRLSRIIPRLDALCDHVLVHTGQNYDARLSDIFFQELEVREPDHYLGVRGETAAELIGNILIASGQRLLDEQPDAFLVLGDTNSALAAIVAKRLGIPVFHMEAGNRCYDDRVPEEINRRVIDHCSDILMPYTERSRANLLREGIEGERIYVTGNPIKEVLDYYEKQIDASSILNSLGLEPKRYFLVTLHRAENVDIASRLQKFVNAFQQLHFEHQVQIVWSVHPRTRSRLQENEQDLDQIGIRVAEPFSFFDFVHLEKHAACVLTDSGTVQEECCIFRVPNVTIRDVTERPETIEVGSNILSGAEPVDIVRCVRTALSSSLTWSPPPEYLVSHVSQVVTKIVLGYRHRL